MFSSEQNDLELLRAYVRLQSEEAFRALVERHLNMVFAVALRQTGNSHLAEEVTQVVFTALARKAASLPGKTILAGWLFRATRFAASNVRRGEARREHWERKAAEMEPQQSPSSELEQIVPVLNEAIERLPEVDRSAILLRFFESRSIVEVGRALGTSEDAAKMRLSRALEKLRVIFRKQGLAVPSAVLVAALSTQAAQAAPVGLALSVAASALSGQSTVIPLVKGTLTFMAKTKLKNMAAAALVVLLGGAGAVFVQQSLSQEPKPGASPKKVEVAKAPVTNDAPALVFRGRRSWNRNPDFEETLETLGRNHEVKLPDEMGTVDLSKYRFVIIPGAQGRAFYSAYVDNAERFESYVTNGGTLVLELNGAEGNDLRLPRDIGTASHPGRRNAIVMTDHPIVAPLEGRTIKASFASHGYLTGVPKDASILAVEEVDETADMNMPTFIEYSHGKGRIIAGFQCFHDQDGSGRGVLMQTVINYAAERKWFSPKR